MSIEYPCVYWIGGMCKVMRSWLSLLMAGEFALLPANAQRCAVVIALIVGSNGSRSRRNRRRRNDREMVSDRSIGGYAIDPCAGSLIPGARKEDEVMRDWCEVCTRWSECNGVDDQCPWKAR